MKVGKRFLASIHLNFGKPIGKANYPDNYSLVIFGFLSLTGRISVLATASGLAYTSPAIRLTGLKPGIKSNHHTGTAMPGRKVFVTSPSKRSGIPSNLPEGRKRSPPPPTEHSLPCTSTPFTLNLEGNQRRIAILGSTGSIGVQALEVIRLNPDRFAAEVLTAGTQAGKLIEQALEFRPNAVVIGDESQYPAVRDALQPAGIKVYAGKNALASVTGMGPVDLVLNALVGYSGLEPTLHAIRSGKPVALANKETLVVAGDLVNRTLLENRVAMIPVDSEHSAIFQCLTGEAGNPIECIYLTASGGPFRGKKRSDLEAVTVAQALRHPNWSMGAKITIDSATLMNKGFEVLEARWLFGLDAGQIRVVVHPQSILHSIVQFEDGSMKAQMGLPDMKLPIQYALTYPDRIPSPFPRFDFASFPSLSFEPPDMETFPCLQLAYEAMQAGGTAACRLNAANEVAVEAFLKEKIRFLDIPVLLAHCLQTGPHVALPDYSDYVESDAETRVRAWEWVNRSPVVYS